MTYWREFLAIAVAHGLAVTSPGADFAIVLRQSLHHGRRTGIWTSVGIGCGLSIHIAYTLLGLGLFLKNSPGALLAVKWLGAAYLAWIGVQALSSRARTEDINLASTATVPTASAAWRRGFFVNLLNPKPALFFISLFPLVVSAATPKWIQAVYGMWMVGCTMAWFSFVAVVFAKTEVRRSFLRYGHWLDRALGVVFIGFAVSLAVMSLN